MENEDVKDNAIGIEIKRFSVHLNNKSDTKLNNVLSRNHQVHEDRVYTYETNAILKKQRKPT